MSRVNVIKLVNDDLQSFWSFLEGSGCKISKKLKEKCLSLQFFRDLDGELQITLQYEYIFPGKVKSSRCEPGQKTEPDLPFSEEVME